MHKLVIITMIFIMPVISVSGQSLKEILKKAAGEALEDAVTESTREITKQKNQEDNIYRNPEPARTITFSGAEVARYSKLGWNPYVYESVADEARDYVFSEDFDTNSKDWFLRDTYRQYATITNGHFIIQSRNDYPVDKSLKVALSESRNFEINTRIKFVQGNSKAANYLNWGKSPFGAFEFGFSGDGRAFTVDRLKGGNYEAIIPWTETDALKSGSRYNKLTIRKAKATYFFFINEKLVGTAPFEDFYGRYLGFSVPSGNQLKIDYLHIAYLQRLDIRQKIKNRVSRKVEQWQKRGKFEKTAAYKERMTEENRNKKIQEFTQEAINELARSKMNYSLLKNDYDPDNEVFRLKFTNFNPVYLPVPIDEAPAFDENIDRLKFKNTQFTLNENNQFAILHLEATNPANGKTYEYDSEQLVAFNSTGLELNFDPVDVNVEGSKTADNVQETKEKVVVGKPEVDTDIPRTNNKKRNTFALIIGNEDYSSFQSSLNSEVDVDYAENDARIFEQYVTHTLGVPEKNVTTLVNATLGQMQQAIAKMNSIAEITGEKAELIFYYSGHGLPDEATKEPYVIPVDVSGKNLDAAIKLVDIYNDLTEYTTKRVTVFLDACFSGGARSQPLVAMKGMKIKPKDHYINGNLVIFSSSTGQQSSNVYREKKHGLFTYFLLKKLQETRGDVTYKQLADYLKGKVELESVVSLEKKQTPQVKFSPKLKGQWEKWEFN